MKGFLVRGKLGGKLPGGATSISGIECVGERKLVFSLCSDEMFNATVG
jgi:hypothetical protein